MWTLSRDDVIIKSKLDIRNKKFMFLIMWNPNFFYVVDKLSNDTKMNSAYFLINVLIPLKELIFPRAKAPHTKQLMIHLDNCEAQTSRTSVDWLEEHNIVRIPHPPYSPDLASSDFDLFP
jgi:histone-lysine N-methyltransferase SETMAR